jgi:hypothetical protein
MPNSCKSIGCPNPAEPHEDFCADCVLQYIQHTSLTSITEKQTLSEKYPKYYKPVGQFEEIDVYAVHHLFAIQDPSGAIQHASKKLLLSGVRTGGKSQFKDIKEARDTLTRWLQLNPETE